MKKSLETWTVNEVMSLYGIKSKTPLLNAEKAGRIPEAHRDSKNVRSWSLADLPRIGASYGFIEKPKNFQFTSICTFTAKGGVLKTSMTLALARIFALNGLKVLIVGNDPQTSITQVITNPLIQNTSLDELPSYKDLGSIIFEGDSLEDVVQKTNIPTLDLLPETQDLKDIGDTMGTLAALAANKGKSSDVKPRHQYFHDILNPIIRRAGYDIAIYDNGPALTTLSENALFACDYWITPNGCDQGSYQVFESNLNDVLAFAEDKNKSWKQIFLVPTVKEQTKLSMQIYGAYISKFPNFVTETAIRRTVKAQEAFALGASPSEVFLKSDIGKDFADLALEIWKKIMTDQRGNSDGN
ncbi:MAG: ParA family protein [Oligoflexus sp.]